MNSHDETKRVSLLIKETIVLMEECNELMKSRVERLEKSARAQAATCACGNSSTLGVVHRKESPCYVAEEVQSAGGEMNQDPPTGYEIDEFIPGVWSYSYTSETCQEMSGCAHWASYNLACLDAWGAYAERLEAKLEAQAAGGEPMALGFVDLSECTFLHYHADDETLHVRLSRIPNQFEDTPVYAKPLAPSVSVEALERVVISWDEGRIGPGEVVADLRALIAASKKV